MLTRAKDRFWGVNKKPTCRVCDLIEFKLAKISYQPPEERFGELEKAGLLGGQIVLNKDEFMSYVYEGKLYNVHRGSKVLEDWTPTDLNLALDTLETTDRFQRAVRDSTESQQLTGMKSIEVGHSLGGALAQRIAVAQNNESVVFNQGTTPLRQQKVDTSRHVHYHNEGDLISAFDPQAITLTSAKGRLFAIRVLTSTGFGTILLPKLINTATQHPLGGFE
jgi:hypothetical protein